MFKIRKDYRKGRIPLLHYMIKILKRDRREKSKGRKEEENGNT
jgi:hypothetical protein